MRERERSHPPGTLSLKGWFACWLALVKGLADMLWCGSVLPAVWLAHWINVVPQMKETVNVNFMKWKQQILNMINELVMFAKRFPCWAPDRCHLITFSSPPYDPLTRHLITKWGSSEAFYICVPVSSFTSPPLQPTHPVSLSVLLLRSEKCAAMSLVVNERLVLWWSVSTDTSESSIVYSGQSLPLRAHTQLHTPKTTHQLCVCASSWPPLSSCVSQFCRLIKVIFSLSGLISITTRHTSVQG